MGNLSNLYVSRSFQSLIHLATDNTASANLIGLEDGYGNPIGVSVNTAGDLSISGSFTASLQNGYVWVGNSSGKTTTVTTSSFGTPIPNGTISGSSQITALGFVSSSITASSLITASFDNGTRNLTFTKGDNSTFAVNIPDVSGSTGNFVTTSSFNAYTASTDSSISQLNASSASQQISIDSLNTNSASVNTSITNLNSATASLFTSVNNINTFTQSAQTSINSLNAATSSYANSASVAAVDAAQQSQINSLIAGTGSYVTSAITGSSLITASFDNGTRNLTFTKGNNTTFAVNIPDVSGSTINTGSFVTTSSFNEYTSSTNSRLTNIESTTASLLIETSNLETFSSSALISISNLNASSASQQISINALNIYTASQSTASIVTSITELNTFTSSANIRLNNLETTSASVNVSISNLNAATSSYITETESGSFLLTASFDNGTRNLTFTKGDATQFSVNIPDVSGSAGNFVTTSSFNSYTASNDQRVSSLEANSASVNISISNLNQTTASLDSSITQLNANSASQQVSINALNVFTASQSTASIITSINELNGFTSSANIRLNNLESNSASVNTSISNINQFTQSQNTYNTNNDTKWSDLGNKSGSWITESETASFARYDVNNPWSAPQTFTSITASSALITNLHTLYETSSVIYSSGSNQFGDELTDTQILSGSVLIVGSGSINGNRILTTADTASLNVLTASYSETSSITRNVVVIARNNNASTLPAGTVVHITSAVGDNPVFTTASYDTEALSSNTFGLLRYSSPSGADVEVVVSGVVTGVNTDPTLGYTAGDIVYLSSSGQFTRVQPQAPNQIVTLGQVLRAQQNNGSIYVSINNGWELNELHNVQITNPQTNNLLAYESASYGLWKNKTYSELGLATTGSNNFVGTQYISASNNVALITTGSIYVGGTGTLISASRVDVTTNIEMGNGTNNPYFRFLSGSSYYNMQLNPSTGNWAFSRDGVSNTKTLQLAGSAGAYTTFENNSVRLENTVPSFEILAPTSSFIGIVSITGQSGNDGRAILLGHSGSFIIGNTTTNTTYGGLSHISSSAANANTNLIFKTNTNTADTIISSSANIFVNPSAPTSGFKRYMTGGNIGIGGSGVAVPQISGSMAFSPTIANNYFGVSANPLTLRGPVSSSTYTINNNVLAGGAFNLGTSAANHFERAVSGLGASGNLLAGTINAVASKTQLSASVTIASNIIGGGATLNMDSSSIGFSGNSVQGNITVNSSYFPSTTGSQVISQVNGGLFVGVNSIYTSGSNTTFTGAAGRTINYASILGTNNVISASLNGDLAQIHSTALIGQGLIVLGTNSRPVASSASDWGSAFVGRWNSIDGTKDQTAETVFAVGTGTAEATRKTGFLIDSGSNTFIEGTLNVSGSTTFNGNAVMTGSLTLSSSAAIELNVIGNVSVTGSINVNSGSYNGQAVTNITPVSSSLSPVLNIVTMTSAEYALITPNSQTLYLIV